MNVHYFVHGRGLGHASRTLPIVQGLLADGHNIRIFGSGDAQKILQRFDNFELVQPDLIRHAIKRLSQDFNRMQGEKPEVVVSDGDAPSLIAANFLGIPTISVGHVLIFSRCNLPPNLPRWAVAAQRLNNFKLSQTANFVIASHFLPITTSHPRTRVARPVLRSDFVRQSPVDNTIVCYFRDANGRSAAEYAVSAGANVICFSDPPISVPGADCRARDPIQFAEVFSTCSAVIASAGSNVCAEAVMMNKPILALHKKRDSEQQMNGLLIELSGVGKSANFETLSSETVTCFLGDVRNKKFETVNLMAKLPDTISAMRDTLEELS